MIEAWDNLDSRTINKKHSVLLCVNIGFDAVTRFIYFLLLLFILYWMLFLQNLFILIKTFFWYIDNFSSIDSSCYSLLDFIVDEYIGKRNQCCCIRILKNICFNFFVNFKVFAPIFFDVHACIILCDIC